jgi:HAMP domain-containing protein
MGQEWLWLFVAMTVCLAAVSIVLSVSVVERIIEREAARTNQELYQIKAFLAAKCGKDFGGE